MRRLVHAAAVAVAALLLGGPSGYAANTNCTSTLNGNLAGTVVVPTGASCTLSNATVTGDVQVRQNASLTVDATAQPTTIGGNVEAVGCASAILEGGVTVTGNVHIAQCAQQSGFIGPGVKIDGNFQCMNNSGGCEAELGTVQGSVQMEGSNSSDISLVSVGGNLQCARQHAGAYT
jgi:hypothetical protein